MTTLTPALELVRRLGWFHRVPPNIGRAVGQVEWITSAPLPHATQLNVNLGAVTTPVFVPSPTTGDAP